MTNSSAKWISRLAAPAGLASLVIIGSLMDSHGAAAQGEPPKPVTITGPLPVPITGTVNANQSGPWNVGILGTPNVNVANTPTVGLAGGASVLVGNASSTPAWVRNVDEAQQPVANSILIGFPANSGEETGTIFSVPAGKRLVTDYASAFCALPAGQGVVVTISAVGEDINLTVTPPVFGSQGLTSVGSPARLYADPSTNVVAILDRTDKTGAGGCYVRFGGHLVNVP